jgi:hypothetical protein
MKLNTFSRSAVNRSQLLDALMDGYVSWREESDAVSESYCAWTRATREERWLAYAAYVAALDREERAACTYRRLVEQVQAA